MESSLCFEIPTIDIVWGPQDKQTGFSVRGISDEDLLRLARSHKEALGKAYAIVEDIQRSGDDTDDIESAKEFGLVLLDEVPELVAQLIALAADMPDRAPDMRKLPAPIKLKALMAIWQLTVVDTGGFEAFFNQVISVMKAVRAEMTSLKNKKDLEALLA